MGTLPLNLLSSKPSPISLEQFPIEFGMLTLSWFPHKLSKIKLDILEKEEGMVLDNLFWNITKNLKVEIFEKTSGMVPEKSLRARSSICKRLKQSELRWNGFAEMVFGKNHFSEG